MNILLDESRQDLDDYVAKICDFGLAHELGSAERLEIPSDESKPSVTNMSPLILNDYFDEFIY